MGADPDKAARQHESHNQLVNSFTRPGVAITRAIDDSSPLHAQRSDRHLLEDDP